MEKANVTIQEIKFTEFETLSATCAEKADLDNIQNLFANRGVNTFVIFLRGLDTKRLEDYKQALLNKELVIVFHDFNVSELTSNGNTLNWVDDDGTARTITKIRAASANLSISDEELFSIAKNSLNSRIANGAQVK